MLELINLILSFIIDLVTNLNNMKIVAFGDGYVTVLGFLGALIIVGVMIRVFLPKT